jgi:hypothetical protein
MKAITSIDIFDSEVCFRQVFNQLSQDFSRIKSDNVGHLKAFGVVKV